ncbi:DUF1254 domain-containing protein [Hydrocoleum sp. CS-953]|uniref:DUF1254 domain-containing protein n=1 Tax=Hydrocoleum sp. CS-953 TaxID=1671698 RepID=UPI000B9C7473|nr:DUF1254 domain-containing protein [Hydrocoleum sp. CS-953]
MILNRIWRTVVVVAIATSLLLGNIILPTSPVLAQVTGDTSENPSFDWEEEYAYTLGVQAFLYALPWTYTPKAYLDRLEQNDGTVNQFMHIRELRDASHQEGGAPTNDTLYSLAVLYLGNEPIILSVPELSERYYTMEMTDFLADNFAYVGKRATGTEAGNYAIVGPNWEGELPPGVKEIEGPSATPWAFLTGRTMVTEEERQTGDREEPHRIQNMYRLTPLSQWLDPDAPLLEVPEICPPYSRLDPLADWKNINCAMVQNPPDPDDSDLLALFKSIGIGPDLNVELQSDSTKRGLERAAVDGLKIVNEAFTEGYGQKQVNGWNYPPPEVGRMSQTGDWLLRAIQVQKGFITHDAIEAIYINASVDEDGNPLSGANRYELRFEEGQEPDVNEFWSITMYDSNSNLVDNPIDRYSLGDRSGMDIDEEDGSLTISIQKDRPNECLSDNECPNWLPTPEGNFFMFMRLYLPGYSGLSQWWEPPALKNLDAPTETTSLSTEAIESMAQEDFWETIIQQVEKRYSTK